MAPWPRVSISSYRSGTSARPLAVACAPAVVGVMAGSEASTDFVEERQPQPADFDRVPALEGRLRHHLAVDPHAGPAGEIAHLVARAVAQDEDVVLRPRRHAQIAEGRAAHQHRAPLLPLEVEGVLLVACLPLEVR